MEAQEASRDFWIGYLEKLKDHLNDGRAPFEGELYEIDSQPFYLHSFRYKNTEGRMVRLLLDDGKDSSTAENLEWSESEKVQREFISYEKKIEAIQELFKFSKICHRARFQEIALLG